MDEKYSFYKTASGDRYRLLKAKAVQMRKNPTVAEAIVWKYIRNKQLGVKFRRQHPIGDYIADFIDFSSKLIIEIDGSIHNLPNQISHDEQRSYFLQSQGYKVIRFTNNEVIGDIDNVILKIQEYINNSLNKENV